MKRTLIFILSTLILVSLCSIVYAGATYDWKIPDNVRIVQKGPADGVRTFNTIQAAINSITDASATNPYLLTSCLEFTKNAYIVMITIGISI